MDTNNNNTGLDALLTPDNSVLVLIDHQAFQFANTRNMDPTMILNNTIGLAKAAKAFKVPTILTTVVSARGGHLPQALQAVFPDQVPIDRTTLNTWEDSRVVDLVKKTGRKENHLRSAVDGDLPRISGDPRAGRRLRCLCRYGRIWRRERRSSRPRDSASRPGGRCARDLDGRDERVAT